MTTEEISVRLSEDHLLGAVKHYNVLSFYLNPIAYWIMDSVRYDPTFRQEDYPDAIFRNGVDVVGSNNANEFLRAIEEDELTLADIVNYLKLNDDLGMGVAFLIDFDNETFVSAFPYIEIEKYIPHNWKGIFDAPVNYFPEEIAKMFPPVRL